MMRRLLLISLLFAMPVSLAAQRGGSGHFSGHSAGRFGAAYGRGGYGRAGGYGVPFFDPLYSDALYPNYDEAADSAMSRRVPAVAEARAPGPPLMIELQGDHYVQVSGDDASQAQMIGPKTIGPPTAEKASLRSDAASTAQTQRAATVLVFRDGHRQEISDYTIANATLYASADYYSSGAWNQKIELASLDLRETLSANRSRGVQFRLPTAANEVIVGP